MNVSKNRFLHTFLIDFFYDRILVPGGQVYFDDKYNNDEVLPNKCVPSFQLIYKIAEEMNSKNTYFPILGICLGFQLLVFMSSNKKIKRIHDCDNEDNSVALEIRERGRLLKSCPNLLQPVLRFNQQYRITEEMLRESDWTILSTAKDRNQKPFVAAIEHKNLPFYGVQFHPERSMVIQEDLRITQESVQLSKHISRFFIDECRKSVPQIEFFENEKVFLFCE